IMYDLIKNNNNLLQLDSLEIKTNRGELIVENRIKSEDAVFILSPKPIEKKISIDINEISLKLKIRKEDIDLKYKISIINAGLTTLLLPIKNLESILEIAPDLEELKDFCFKHEIDIIEVFSCEVADKNNNYRTRVFAPTFGYLEDPATGSGNSAFGYFLIKNGLWVTETITIEQNGFRDKYNIVKLQKKMDSDGKERVYFGGGAITRIEGNYILQK
ncbi:MAG TPA: PhzF family phenazine biosynthesis isomerase, partial [Spirochaetota bacterium]|nr:PhzF family phenazine biosynthesis isomerase [Spirochaetota bacterium]